jgi:hypothetical protein
MPKVAPSPLIFRMPEGETEYIISSYNFRRPEALSLSDDFCKAGIAP